jgi:quercetin dioxygenase-like cupin family protein
LNDFGEHKEATVKQNLMLCLSAACIFIGIIGFVAIQAQPAPSPTRRILSTDLQNIPGQEVLFFTTDWAPGQSLRCHVHPDGHEFAYIIEGELTFSIKGVGERVVKAGEVNYLAPGIPHYGRNASNKLARTLVVRIKDKSKPIVSEVETSNCSE